MSASRVLSVNVGRAVDTRWAGRLRRTAIDKRPAGARVTVRHLGLAGDEQADTANHGGPHQAVYAYAREDLDWWEPQLGYDLRDGAFGENLTLRGVDTTTAVIGEQWRIGTVVLEVADARIPCGVFRAWMGERGWVKRFAGEARPGTYLSVAEEGELAAGDILSVLNRPEHGITVRDVFRAFYGDRDALERLRRALDMPPPVRALADSPSASA